MTEASNTSGITMQPLTIGDLTDEHVGQRISFHGLPTSTLHSVIHSKHGYAVLGVGRHTVTVHDGVRVQVYSEVDGL